MKSKNVYQSDILASIHETVSELYSLDLLSESKMKEFDEICLSSIQSLKPEEIKAIRQEQNLSQEVFAKYLNVSSRLILQWENGEKKPKGSSLKLLNLVKNKGISILI